MAENEVNADVRHWGKTMLHCDYVTVRLVRRGVGSGKRDNLDVSLSIIM